MPEISPQELFPFAIDFRATLEQKGWDAQTAFQGLVLTPKDAPSRGQCGVSSVYVARSLFEIGYRDTVFVDGYYNKPSQSEPHCWVQVGGIIVDVTSDQFDDTGSFVFVGHSPSRRYTADTTSPPFEIPHKKLMVRYNQLEANLKRNRIQRCLNRLAVGIGVRNYYTLRQG